MLMFKLSAIKIPNNVVVVQEDGYVSRRVVSPFVSASTMTLLEYLEKHKLGLVQGLFLAPIYSKATHDYCSVHNTQHVSCVYLC